MHGNAFWINECPFDISILMNEIFRSVMQKIVLVFFDDILVYSTSWIEHLIHLKEVIQLLQHHQFQANRKMCTFGQQEVEYLGHIISQREVVVDPNKVKSVCE